MQNEKIAIFGDFLKRNLLIYIGIFSANFDRIRQMCTYAQSTPYIEIDGRFAAYIRNWLF